MDLHIVRREIHQYLENNDWVNTYDNLWYTQGDVIDLSCYYFCGCKKYDDNKMDDWEADGPNDKYVLEYIGQILRKHKIKEVWVDGDMWKYQSEKWTFDTIKKI